MAPPSCPTHSSLGLRPSPSPQQTLAFAPEGAGLHSHCQRPIPAAKPSPGPLILGYRVAPNPTNCLPDTVAQGPSDSTTLCPLGPLEASPLTLPSTVLCQDSVVVPPGTSRTVPEDPEGLCTVLYQFILCFQTLCHQRLLF